MVRVNRKMNLVVPLQRGEHTLYVHSMPLLRETYEQYFEVIAGAFSRIYKQGLSIISGPRVAALMLRRVAESLGSDTADGVMAGLLMEMRRLSSVVMLTDRGWDTITLDAALTRELLDEDEVAEVEGYIAFFICASAIHRKDEVASMLAGMARVWSIQTTLLSATEWKTSLPTSTVTGTSSPTPEATASSVPS